MTILSLDTSTVSSNIEKIISPYDTEPHAVSQLWSIPRINLRKRPVGTASTGTNNTNMTNLESVNSAFLSGLFADVAKASSESTSSNDVELVSHPTKKSRMGKRFNSIARCERSFAVLMKAFTDTASDVLVDNHTGESCGVNSNTAIFGDAIKTAPTFHRDNSLQYQLDCVTASSSNTSTATTTSKRTDISSATGVVFPNLPATVSNSSYGNSLNTTSHNSSNSNRHPTVSSPITTPLTHVIISDLQSSNTENQSPTFTNDTYGWFVEMEDDSTTNVHVTNTTIPTPTSSSVSSKSPLIDAYFAPKDLAFTVQVAPKAENYDAELEWATAADTVDDVLGCFF